MRSAVQGDYLDDPEKSFRSLMAKPRFFLSGALPKAVVEATSLNKVKFGDTTN